MRSEELSNYGERLLNPELAEILAHADRRGVAVTADNGVNLCAARPDQLEAMVARRLRSLTLSIDGATQETYDRYRVRGDLAAGLANVRTLLSLRRARGARYPRVRWQMVVLGHAEHEIEVARELARELGTAFVLELAWDDETAPVRDAALVRRATVLGVATAPSTASATAWTACGRSASSSGRTPRPTGTAGRSAAAATTWGTSARMRSPRVWRRA